MAVSQSQPCADKAPQPCSQKPQRPDEGRELGAWLANIFDPAVAYDLPRRRWVAKVPLWRRVFRGTGR